MIITVLTRYKFSSSDRVWKCSINNTAWLSCISTSWSVRNTQVWTKYRANFSGASPSKNSSHWASNSRLERPDQVVPFKELLKISFFLSRTSHHKNAWSLKEYKSTYSISAKSHHETRRAQSWTWIPFWALFPKSRKIGLSKWIFVFLKISNFVLENLESCR